MIVKYIIVFAMTHNYEGAVVYTPASPSLAISFNNWYIQYSLGVL